MKIVVIGFPAVTRDSERRVSKRGSASPQSKSRLRLGSLQEKQRRGAADGELKTKAALRLLVPVKLGLKNIKAITRITYTKDEPRTIGQNAGIHAMTEFESAALRVPDSEESLKPM